ncbi:ABC transporter permease [Malaciobacter mytili]|uniref:MlaE family ABC transporter permease n=1 Tax=Malaciobacter mytili TaxID=603050 RepID=UPI003BB0E98E
MNDLIADIKIEEFENNSLSIFLLGKLNKQTLPKIIKKISLIKNLSKKQILIDCKDIKQLDSSAAIYLISLDKKLNFSIINLNKFEKLYNHYKKYYQEKDTNLKSKNNFIINLGKSSYKFYLELKEFIYFFGKISYFFIYSLMNPKKIRFKAMLKYIDSSAINAMGIIALTSFLVGIVIAYQGAVQLEKFGANIFIVEMICITMFREIAPLVTAIVIAGRTASSYTAEIGAMKITDEIDAMKTMGFEPTIFLTLPRVFALFISLPLLVFFADIIGVFAGMLIANLDLNITFLEFINRMYAEVPLKHLLIGIIKSMFFGIFIALIGCYRGFQVQNNTTSIGKYTTISVVSAIFVVIAFNALFSVVLTESGL